jgi:tetratricopeptide (TPR) repeat protein
MVIVDTGSADDSPDIARSFGARLVRAPWTDSFAAARNRYLDLARGDWILSLDADEVCGPTDPDRLRRGLARYRRAAFVCDVRNYFPMGDSSSQFRPGRFAGEVRPGLGCAVTRTVRLFRHHSGARYSYPVHESLRPSLVRYGFRLGRWAAPIHHNGYLVPPSVVAAKIALYRRLGEIKVRQFPRYPLAYVELGKVVLQQGELARAEHLFRQCLALDPKIADAHYYLATTYLRLGAPQTARRVLEEAVRRFPRRRAIRQLLVAVDRELAGRRQNRVAGDQLELACSKRACDAAVP